MSFEFDQHPGWKGHGSAKWDAASRVFGRAIDLPMWVADMDFASPPVVAEGLAAFARQGFFGYPVRPDKPLEQAAAWMRLSHGWAVEPSWMSVTPGALAGLALAVNAFSRPGDKIIVQPPVYYPFYSIILKNGRQILPNPLIRDENGYRMDLDHLASLMDQDPAMMILCSPHNPVGRVWTAKELSGLGRVLTGHGLVVVSDELHADLVHAPARHTPLALGAPELAETALTLMSPSKTFNLAGLKTSLAITPNPKLKQALDRQAARLHVAGACSLGVEALALAYAHGRPWLEELLAYLAENIRFMKGFLSSHLPRARLAGPEGTYLAWLDLADADTGGQNPGPFLAAKAGLGLDDGALFGQGGAGFVRLNFACPRWRLEEALERMAQALGGGA